jgi:hypothetical protein
MLWLVLRTAIYRAPHQLISHAHIAFPSIRCTRRRGKLNSHFLRTLAKAQYAMCCHGFLSGFSRQVQISANIVHYRRNMKKQSIQYVRGGKQTTHILVFVDFETLSIFQLNSHNLLGKKLLILNIHQGRFFGLLSDCKLC